MITMSKKKAIAGFLAVAIVFGGISSCMDDEAVTSEPVASEQVKKEEPKKKEPEKKPEPKKEEPKGLTDEERKQFEQDVDKVFAEMEKAAQGSVSIEYHLNGDSYFVDVIVEETMWAVASDSEKLSFMNQVGDSVQLPFVGFGLVETIDHVWVDFKSASVGDKIGTEKMLGGYKIKR